MARLPTSPFPDPLIMPTLRTLAWRVVHRRRHHRSLVATRGYDRTADTAAGGSAVVAVAGSEEVADARISTFRVTAACRAPQ